MNKNTALSYSESLSRWKMPRSSLACGYRKHWLQGIAGSRQKQFTRPCQDWHILQNSSSFVQVASKEKKKKGQKMKRGSLTA